MKFCEKKKMKKYLTIGEISNITDVPDYTLRYWESEFNLLRPLRRESGQRRYTHDDLHTIEKIKNLLYEQKYSIAGAKKELMKEKKQKGQMNFELSVSSAAVKELQRIKRDLLDIKNMLSDEI